MSEMIIILFSLFVISALIGGTVMLWALMWAAMRDIVRYRKYD